jgi:hypothetical protein
VNSAITGFTRAILQLFGINQTVFYFHFQTRTTLQLASAHNIDSETVNTFAAQQIIQCVQSDELFMCARHIRDQWYHGCRVLPANVNLLCLTL